MSINRPSRVNSTSRIAGNIGVKASTSAGADGGNVNGLAPGNGYKYHTFTSTGTFSVAAGPLNLTDPNFNTYDHNTKTIGLTDNGASPIAGLNVELLLIGGGASGYGQAGGGAGGLVVATNFPISGPVTVTIGAGGAYPAAPPVPFPIAGGVDTTISSPTMTTVTAGGGGQFVYPLTPTGGSSTGFTPNPVSGKINASPGPTSAQPTLNPTYSPDPNFNQYGSPGGQGYANDYKWQGGGGGGAGGAGGDSPATGGPNPIGPGGGGGGAGRQYPEFTGPLIGLPALNPLSGYYAGGGGANNENYPSNPAPFGNSGGAGGGGNCAGGAAPNRDGVDNTGSGGGANYSGWYNPDPQRAGNGGSGIAVIRYSV